MKMKRKEKDYGSGSGYTTYESALFRVVKWHMSNGIKTEINVEFCPSLEIEFDGDLTTEFSDEDTCMEQLTAKEIMLAIECQKKISFNAGKEEKAREFRSCLGIF